MAKINKQNSEIVKGDEVAKFVLLSNSHDGSTAVRVGFTPIRVVCANTLTLAHGDKASKLIRVRHSKDVKKNVDNIKEIMNLADAEFEATAEQFRFLASKQINLSDLRRYVKLVFEMEMDDAKMAKKTVNIMNELLELHEKRTGMLQDAFNRAVIEDAIKNGSVVQAICDKVEENMEAGRGTENPLSRGTIWTAYNAVTEYLNHQKGNGKPDVRLESVWFGESMKTSQRALSVAMDIADKK